MKDAKQVRSSQGARQSSWLAGLAALTITPLASALGLGQATVNSYYEQPLDVRIDLISRSEAEMATVTAGLASPADFQIMGLTRSALGTPLQFSINRDLADPHIRVTSRQPMTEPVVQLVLEVVWSSGRMLRQYTVFLDPPSFESPAPLPATRRAEAPAPEVASAPAPAATTSPFREAPPVPVAPASEAPAAVPEPRPVQREPEPSEAAAPIDRGPPFAPAAVADEPEPLSAPPAAAPAGTRTIADAVDAALDAETDSGMNDQAPVSPAEAVIPEVPVTEPEQALQEPDIVTEVGLAEESLAQEATGPDNTDTPAEAAEDAESTALDVVTESPIDPREATPSVLADAASSTAAGAGLAAAATMAETDEMLTPSDADAAVEEITEVVMDAVPETPDASEEIAAAAAEVDAAREAVLSEETGAVLEDTVPEALPISDGVDAAAEQLLDEAPDELPAAAALAEAGEAEPSQELAAVAAEESTDAQELAAVPAQEMAAELAATEAATAIDDAAEPEPEPEPEPVTESTEVLTSDVAGESTDDASSVDEETVAAAADEAVSDGSRFKALLPAASAPGQRIEVARGDTTWSLSRDIAVANGVSINQVMLALQQSNPQAFRDNNINRLMAGAILRVPERDEMVRLSAREAMLEAQRQEQIYRSRGSAVPAAEDLPRIANPEQAPDELASVAAETAPPPEDDPMPLSGAEEPMAAEADGPDEVAPSSLLELVPPSESGDGSRQDFGQGSEGDTGQSSASADGDLARTQEDLANAEQERSYLAERIDELEAELGRRDAQPEDGVRDTTLAEMEQRLEAERLAAEEAPPVQVRADDEPVHWLSRFGAWLLGGLVLLVLGLVAFLRSRRDPEIISAAVTPPEGDVSDSDAAVEAAQDDLDSGADDMPAEPSPETLRALAASTPAPPAPEPSVIPPGEEAIALSGDDPETLLDLARAYMSMGREADVRSLLDEVFRIGTPEQVEEARAMLREI